MLEEVLSRDEGASPSSTRGTWRLIENAARIGSGIPRIARLSTLVIAGPPYSCRSDISTLLTTKCAEFAGGTVLVCGQVFSQFFVAPSTSGE